jgi:hypothetical protein
LHWLWVLDSIRYCTLYSLARGGREGDLVLGNVKVGLALDVGNVDLGCVREATNCVSR